MYVDSDIDSDSECDNECDITPPPSITKKIFSIERKGGLCIHRIQYRIQYTQGDKMAERGDNIMQKAQQTPLIPPCQQCGRYQAECAAWEIEYDEYDEPVPVDDDANPVLLCDGCAENGEGATTGHWDWRNISPEDIANN